ncbi:putative DNA polymerase III delta' subunit [uncultured delta proteobacterium]|uniref:Putative DNA polymerase III delta' subunit n=1 Tax=uncultured delta proteobacterium TaxID=34034 RepID=A0A212JTH7_9DELT|nr:putative DNA polymerase III delta' subunit [uncultured delta proteobacterium]
MTDDTATAGAKKRPPREAEADSLPAAGDMASLAAGLRSLAGSGRHGRAFSFLRSLAASPPRVILLEGGSAKERADFALYWGMALNCEAPLSDGEDGAEPCLACPVCLKFLARLHRDLFFLDGTAGSITIDEVRAVRATLGEAARESKYRVVILSEAQSLTEAAANAMLKSLEEALPATVFVLTAPQRERLLPTLVSRSWVLTLAWPDPLVAKEDGADPETARGWAATAAKFLATGSGLFDRTGARGGVDAAGALALILVCQRAMAQVFSGMTGEGIAPGASPEADLARFFASLPENRLAIAGAVLAEGQESVTAQVNPALVADWVMTRLYLLRPKGRS